MPDTPIIQPLVPEEIALELLEGIEKAEAELGKALPKKKDKRKKTCHNKKQPPPEQLKEHCFKATIWTEARKAQAMQLYLVERLPARSIATIMQLPVQNIYNFLTNQGLAKERAARDKALQHETQVTLENIAKREIGKLHRKQEEWAMRAARVADRAFGIADRTTDARAMNSAVAAADRSIEIFRRGAGLADQTVANLAGAKVTLNFYGGQGGGIKPVEPAPVEKPPQNSQIIEAEIITDV